MPPITTAETILLSNNIFTGTKFNTPFSGFVAIADGKILAAGTGDGAEYTTDQTRIKNFGDATVCPGFIDSHCFFTGYAMGFVGADLAACTTVDDALAAAEKHAAGLTPDATILGHGLKTPLDTAATAALEAKFGERPAVLFAEGNETCLMNAAARQRYGFTPDTCYSEALWRLIAEVMRDRAYIVPMFRQYMKLMNSKGVTSVKEMGFDDYYGFADVLEELDRAGELTLRVSFMSQPVGAGMNLAHGLAMRDRFKSDFVRFSGYNRMTDGSIGQHCGDLKQPYNDKPETRCEQDIDYAAIEQEVLAADAEGFRFSLHAQGDAAVAKVLDIYEKCVKDADGRVKNRHAITDLELTDPADLERMARLGVIAEIYPQIPTLYNRQEKVDMIKSRVGDRGRYYWNRRKMADSGVTISCATDLPLLIDDISESAYCACGGYFNDGGEPFNPGNTLTLPELIRAWCHGGATNLSCEDRIGTLEVGKAADIAVLDAPMFSMKPSSMRGVKVSATYIAGREVYSGE